MSNKPGTSKKRVSSSSKERIIPIVLETDQNRTLPEQEECKDVIDASDEELNVSEAVNTTNAKRTLPAVNTKEKVILVIDTAVDDNCTPFKTSQSEQSPLNMLKQTAEIFIHNKHFINSKHEFALVTLNSNSAEWVVDFNNNMNKIKNSIRRIEGCEVEDIFELTSLFDVILQNAQPPTFSVADDVTLPPSYVLRVILFYGRSYTIPKLLETDAIMELLKHPYFTLDVVMTHEPVDKDNNCDEIFNVLQNLDKKGFAYAFSVARDASKLNLATAKLLGHPLQRAPLVK